MIDDLFAGASREPGTDITPDQIRKITSGPDWSRHLVPAPDWLRQIPQCGWGQQVEKETGGAASQEKHRRESEREREGRVIMLPLACRQSQSQKLQHQSSWIIFRMQVISSDKATEEKVMRMHNSKTKFETRGEIQMSVFLS